MFPISFLVSPSPSHSLASPTSISTLILCGGVRAICLSKIKIKSDGGCSKTRKVICYLSELWALVNPAINNVFFLFEQRGWEFHQRVGVELFRQKFTDTSRLVLKGNSTVNRIWKCLVIFVCWSVIAAEIQRYFQACFLSLIPSCAFISYRSFQLTLHTYLWNFFCATR